MKPFCEKIYLQLNPPTEDLPLGDRERIVLALETLGYAPVRVPLTILQRLYRGGATGGKGEFYGQQTNKNKTQYQYFR